MTFEEFLAYIRKHVGRYCGDRYWSMIYKCLPEHTTEYIRKETPYLAIHAVAVDYSSNNREKDV